MIINVTQRDIKEARRRKRNRETEFYSPSCDCPIAIAARRVFKRRLRVGPAVIHVKRNSDSRERFSRSLLLPKSAVVFINRFDSDKFVVPFSFEIK